MRFFSKKVIENLKITLFSALKFTSGLFGVGFLNTVYKNISSAYVCVKNNALSKVALALLLLVVIGGVGVKHAFSAVLDSTQNTPIKSVLHVYPSVVSNFSWSGIDSVLTPDLPEDAIYQKFSARNSAYVPLTKIVDTTPQPQTQIDTTTQPPISPAGQVLEPTPETGTTSPTATTTAVQGDTQTTDTPAVPSDVPTSATPEQSSQDAGPTSLNTVDTSGSKVVLKQATLSAYTFFQSITKLIPFLNNNSASVTGSEEQVASLSSDASNTQSNQVPTVQNAPTSNSSSTQNTFFDESIPHIDNPDGSVSPIVPVSTPVEPQKTVQSVAAPAVPKVQNQNSEQPLQKGTKSLTLSDFSVPQLKPGEFITGVQLRMSLGAKYHNQTNKPLPSLKIVYKTPSSTQEVGSVVIDGEVSNALNGGYFLFALPEITTIAELQNVSIQVSYLGDTEHLDGLFVDAAWLEVSVEKVDKSILENEVKTDTQDALEAPKLSTLISTQLDFARTELPHFSLRYNSQRNIAVRFLRSLFGQNLASVADVSFVHNDTGDIGAKPAVTVTSDGLISIQFTNADMERLQPGQYTVNLDIDEGGVLYQDSFQFQWGLLSVNSDKTSYLPNQTATISLGSLSQNGNTVCDANLQLYIIDPHDTVTKTPVTASGLCNGNNVVDVPDYSASFTPTIEGEYEMYVERLDTDGSIMSHTSDTFLVSQDLPLSIRRVGPSRIYPKATYPMKLSVESTGNWKGKLIEVVPADFVISDTDAHITQKGNEMELSWDVSVTADAPKTVSYTFDAPDISPYLYMLGSARLEGEAPTHLKPTLASSTPPENVQTATTTVTAPSNTTTTTAAATVATDTVSSSTPTTSSATATDTSVTTSTTSQSQTLPTVDASTITVAPAAPSLLQTIINAIPFFGTSDAPVVPPTSNPAETTATSSGDSSTLTAPAPSEQMVAQETVDLFASTSSSTQSIVADQIPTADSTPKIASVQDGSVVFTEHRKWQVASDATGSMIVYWTNGASIPGGWTCLSCGSGTFYQKFVRGGASYNVTGGSATHIHNASGTVGSATGTLNSENNAGALVSQPSHSHTITPVFVATSSLPAYRQLRVIQNNSAGEPASIPAGAVLIFDSTLPSGWARYTALDGRYPRGENTLANGGSNTHRHNIIGTTSAASGSTLNGRTGGTQVTSADAAHTHRISTTTSAVSIEPPFITVIFATSSVATSTPTGAVTMWTDTPPAQWQNESATTSDPFYDNFIKGSATYGTTGGSLTHTHPDIHNVVTSNALTTHGARTGATGISNVHTHLVDITNITAASNLPPYLTAIFGRKYGAIPLYTQKSFRFFINNASTTPTDAWPIGTDFVAENDPIDSNNTPLKNGDAVRIRMQLAVSNSTSTSDTFKLQFGSTTAACSAITVWTDVGSATSSAMWRGYDNVGISDGSTIASSTLTGTNVFETYEENNPTATTPNTIGIGKKGEWDFAVQQNNALPGTTYCFRMVKTTGAALFAYAQYPMLVTNQAPNPPDLSKLFDNEKTATTTPDFEFSASDVEGNDLTYQIQVDNDYNFSSTVIDKNSVTNSSVFDNLATPADKDPFNQGETIHFNNTTALSNGTTYYWRVRAKDPTGSNAYGNWSTIRSFTVDTSVTLATWFQTATEQFNTNTLDGVLGTTSLAKLKTGSSTGTMYSTPIDFDTGLVGTAWGSFSWNDTEITSNLKYTIQYNNDGTWTDIPDAVLPGNGAGFGTSPVSLLPVDKTIYTELRIKATFTNSGASPTLLDWTITWGYLIETPTISAPFGNEKVSTTTPTFKFTTTDPQSDSLQYQIQWSTSYTFAASTTRNSNVNAGFSNLSHATDTDPFNSGDNIQFKIQTADALTNGTTYWWRVRARDPGGSNTYSFFTDPQSFTVDTAVTVSTWFQTTQSQFANDTLSNTTALSTGVVTVSTTTTNSLIAYGEGNVTTPKYRIWNGSTWSAQGSALDVGATIAWTVTKASPIKSEYVMATLGTDAHVNAQVYSNGAWGHLQKAAGSVPSVSLHGFDVAYEQASGDAMVVACDGDADPTYYIWNGTTWTSGNVGFTGNTCGVIKLISNPTSDEIIVVIRDTGGLGYKARVWNGSSWGNEAAAWGTMQAAQAGSHEGIAAEYVESGNPAIVAVSNGTAASFTWKSWNGSTWSGATTQALGNDFESGHLVNDKGTDNMAMCYVDEDGDMGVVRWTAGAWVAFVELQTGWGTGAQVFNDRPIDCAFEVGGARDGFIMATYATPVNGLRYRSWNGAAWAAEAAASTIGTGPRVQLRRVGSANLLQAISYSTTTDSYRYTSWNGSAWAAQQTLEADGSTGASPYKEPFMIAPANPAAVGTVVGDPVLNYDDGSGPYWKQMSWTDTTTGGSDILYQVQYFDGTNWLPIPNSLIPGNSVGTTTSPINLSNVLPVSTYNLIRPVANMTCHLGTCPSLSDWNITWAAGINISGTAKQFDQTTNVTSGTVAVAKNGVLQTGKTGTISGGTWTIANVNAKAGDVLTIFISGAADANEAVAVTKYDGVGDMTGVNLYERHVSIGSDDNQTITNANMALYDFTNTEDIFYDVNGSNQLNVCATTGCKDAELIIKALNTYQPGSGGDVQTYSFENNGTLKLNGNTMRVSGFWDNNATTSPATSTVILNATSSAKTFDETGAISPSFNNLIFGQSTSTATWTLVTPLDVNGNLTVNGGTLARGSQTINIGGNLTNAANGVWTGIATTTFDGTAASTWTDSSAGVQNIGKVVIDGTIKSITLGSNVKARSITIGSDDTLDASVAGYTITDYTNWKNNNTFTARTGTVNFAATTSSRVITTGSSNFYNLAFTGTGGAWSFTGSTLGVDNDFSITAAGTVTMPSATTTIAGSFTNSSGTFVHNNGLVYFTTSGSKTITQNATALTNAFYNVRFTGTGSWTYTDTNATTSSVFRITQGNVTMPSGTLTIGDTFTNSGGTFSHNNGTIKFINTGTRVIDTNSSFYSLRFAGSGSAFSFLDSSVTLAGNLTVTAGTVTLPSGTLTVGGSISNTATLAHNSGTVLLNATSTGKTIDLGNSSLFNLTFNGAAGGWTVSNNATTTNNTTITAAAAFTLASGKRLSVGGTFTNSVGGAATTWTGSTLVLQSGNYSINTKTNTGDVYNILQVQAGTNIKMWNSSASTYNVNSSGSLYSQDHNGVDGDLYIFGTYSRSSGTEYWANTTDFDGVSLGTSTRRVAVRFASGAVANFTNSVFIATGSSTATTTVANQGSGSYLINISGGTTTASYYSFSNLGSTGLSLLASNKVTSLANGAFFSSVAAGSSITVSSTTINKNPALQIQHVNFSTTSAVVAKNVSQTDGTPTSYWWFRNSTGNLDGEAYDFDTGNPGSIRWDDSALVLTVSGKVYTDDGVTPLAGGTCNGIATPVRIKVTGGGTYDGSCSAVNGTYSIPGVTVVGDQTLTVFLNGASGGQKAVTVTKTPTQDISNLDLYGNRVIVRHQDPTSPITVYDMAPYDSTDDTDIMFTAATGTTPTLTLNANTELFVWATSTFNPRAKVTLKSGGTGTTYDGSLHIAPSARFISSSSATTTVGGTFRMDAGSVFTHATGTVAMAATTSGKAITIASGVTANFNKLRFTGAGGGWNLTGNISAANSIQIANGTVTGTANITLPNGSFYGNGLLSLGSGTTTLARTNTYGGTQGWTFANLVLGNGVNVGTTTPASNATTTISGKLTISTAHFLRGLGARFNLSGSGSVFAENGTFLEATSTVRYSGSAATNILSTGYYNLEAISGAGSPTYTATGLGIVVANNFTVGNGVTTVTVNFDTSDPALDVNGNLAIAANGTLVGSNSAACTVAGNWTNNGTFTASGGTVTFDGSGSPTINAGASSFANAIINGTGSFTISQNATATAAFSLTAASAFTLTSGKTLAVGGTFTNGVGGAATTWTGSTLRLYSGTNYQINSKTINDVYATLLLGANTNIRMWNSSASTYTLAATASLYSQDHNAVDGTLNIYGNYPGNGSTDYWSYARDFDGTVLGTTSRQANVRFLGGSTMVLQSGGLQVLGAPGATTTITNQGSGTFGMRVGGSASTTWSYYNVQNTDTNGLTFSGSANVVDISRGVYTVTTAGGSGITVGGSVINANPAKTFTNNVFATTTAIAAFNVTATGTPVSSWRFTNHSGNLAGEAHDNDPNGDPGYIVWDNSAANITISGHVYSDEGVTPSGVGVCNGVTQNVKLRVAGLTTYTTSCASGTGAYSISGVSYSPGDALVVYITPAGTERGATVTQDPVSNISNLDIYESRVIVRHEGVVPLAIDDMALWSSTNDAFVPFTAVNGSPDTLTLPANRKLLIWTGKEFKPGGNVTVSGGGAGAAYDGTLEAQTNAILTMTGTQQLSIGGSIIFGTGATFSAGLSTTTFTTTGAARTIDVNNQGFYNTAFTGSGSWTVTDSIMTLHTAKITAGTVTLPTGTTTVSGSWINNGGAFVVNGSPLLFTATSSGNSIRAGGSNFKNLKFSGTAGSWSMIDTNATSTGSFTVTAGTVSLPSGIFSVAKSFRNVGGAITHNLSKLYLTSSSSATLKASSSSLYSVTFKGSGPFTLADKNLTLLKDFTILQGSVTLATGTLSVGGSWVTSGGTFAHASGTVLFNATTTGRTITPGSSTFYDIVFGSASGGWTINSNATSTHNFTLTTAAQFTQASSTRLYVKNVFTNSVGGAATTWKGSTLVLNSGTTYAINLKSSGGDDYQTLKIGANTAISMWNSKATTTIMTTTSGSLYSQNHGAVSGALNIYGDYHISTSTKYWSYATDFDGTLLGGSSRNVTVSMAANATTTVDGGTLFVNGAAGHVTTITNQGSGTFAQKVTSGTFNASYYAYRNLNASGLKFSGSPTVTSLSQGDFVLAVAGGSLITLSSSTLNANASLIITGNSFATTSAITGKNVTLLGTTSNAWTFTSHSGNLAGEKYDVDGATACGSIRWSDSACLLTQQTHYRWRNNDGGLDAPNSEWFNTNWAARQRVRLQNTDSTTYTNAVVKVHVTYDSDMRTDFNDLRFTTAGGTTTLKYFVDRYTPSTDADVWVKVPSIPGSDTTTLFMYYKNATASSTSSSTQTFIAADDFEDGSKTEYSGDTSLFTVSGSFPYGGSYGLDTVGNQNAKATHGIARFDTTVSQGQIIRYMQYVDTSAGSGDEVCTLFGVQSPVTLSHNYGVCLEQVTGPDRISLVRDTANVDLAAGSTMISSTTVAYTTGWYQVEVDWKSGGNMTVRLSKAGSLVATISGTDNTYTTGGIGFTYWFQHGGWDNYSARPRVTTEPTVRFGAEETYGGATWKAAIDTPASFTAGNKARLRFAVENTGLQITNRTFDLEYAAKGASPSCEAVSSGSYTHLPVQGSCGSSPLCMATSSVVTNGATVNDLLFGPTIDYKIGKAVTSPSYTTAALTLNQNEYTELEYVLTPTTFAVSPNYCLRVTNAGAAIDTYLKVAELQMKFDPTVTGVSLNSGSDISLVPGATTTVTITGTATDLNGYTDMVSASSTMYRSGAGPACAANNTNCYISRGAPKCNFSSCAGNSCTIACTADLYYFADATDPISPLYSGQNWQGFIEVHDTNNGIGVGSAPGVELLSLNAMSVNKSIAYGALAVSSTTGSFNPTTTISNLGNNSIDISVLGGNLTDGGSSVIPANKERFATSSFTYNTCTVCTTLSTTTIARYNVNLGKQTTINTPSTKVVYWGIAIPFGVASKPHSGVNTFYAITDL